MKKLLTLFLSLISFVTTVYADIDVVIEITESTLMIGDEATFQLKINGTKDRVDLRFPTIDGLTFRQIGLPSTSSQTTIINGKMDRFSGSVYSIGLSASRKGTFQVPGLSIVHDGQVYQSNPFNIRVIEPNQQDTMRLSLDVSKPSVYINEPLDITLKWYIQESVSEYAFRFPLLDQKDSIQLRLVESNGNEAVENINVQGYTIPFYKSDESFNGEQYTVYKVTFRVFPQVPGEFELASPSVRASVQRGTTMRRDFFDRLVRVPKTERIFASSEAKTVDIKAIPMAQRPVSFTGAVGNFSIRVSTETAKAKVGDPVEISIIIAGEGRLENIERPTLSGVSELVRRFSVEDSLQPGDIRDSSVVFKDMIRPRHESVTDIPPIPFSFFDPDREKFITTLSEAVPLTVLQAKTIDEKDIVSFSKTANQSNRSFKENQKGIYSNYTFEDALVSQSGNWYWVLILTIPPVVYLVLLVIVRRKRFAGNNQAVVRSKSAKTAGAKRLKKAKALLEEDKDAFLAELSRSLGGYISDRLNLGLGEMTVSDIQRLEKTNILEKTTATELVSFMEELDRIRFTGASIPIEDRKRLFDRVDDLLRLLSRQL